MGQIEPWCKTGNKKPRQSSDQRGTCVRSILLGAAGVERLKHARIAQ